jgi:hypothetical protein
MAGGKAMSEQQLLSGEVYADFEGALTELEELAGGDAEGAAILAAMTIRRLANEWRDMAAVGYLSEALGLFQRPGKSGTT